MSEILTFLGIAAEWHTTIGWTGILAIGGGAIVLYNQITKRFKAWLTQIVAHTPRSKQAQNGLRQAVDDTKQVVKQIAEETKRQGERISRMEGAWQGLTIGLRHGQQSQVAPNAGSSA